MTSFFFTFFLQYCWSHRLRPPPPRLRGAREKPIHLWQVERVVLNALVKQMRLCRPNLISSKASRAMRRRSCAFGGWFWHRPRKRSGPIHLSLSVRRQNGGGFERVSSTRGTDRFERATLRRSVFGIVWILIEGKERGLSRYRALWLCLPNQLIELLRVEQHAQPATL